MILIYFPSLRVYGKLDKASSWLLLQNPLVHSKYKRYISLLLYGLIFIITHRSRTVNLVSSFFTDNLKFFEGLRLIIFNLTMQIWLNFLYLINLFFQMSLVYFQLNCIMELEQKKS